MIRLDLESLFATYGNHHVLHDITAHVLPGELVILSGANAAGKSTLIRVLAGMYQVRQGRVAFQGMPGDARPPTGLAVEPAQLPNALTGSQAIQLISKALRGDPGQALAYADAVELRIHLDAFIGTYSLGTRQKLAICLALVGDPRLLLLDESLNGLDLVSVERTLEFVHGRSRATQLSCVLATHNLDLAQPYCDRVWFLANGRLAHRLDATDLIKMRNDGILLSRHLLGKAQSGPEHANRF